MANYPYPLHPGQTHAEPLYATIPLEEYESLHQRIAALEKENAELKSTAHQKTPKLPQVP